MAFPFVLRLVDSIATTPVVPNAWPDYRPRQPDYLRRLFRRRFPALKALYEERYASFCGQFRLPPIARTQPPRSAPVVTGAGASPASAVLTAATTTSALSHVKGSSLDPPAPRIGPSFQASTSAGTSFSTCPTVSSSGPYPRSYAPFPDTTVPYSPTWAGSSSTSCPPVSAGLRAGRSRQIEWKQPAAIAGVNWYNIYFKLCAGTIKQEQAVDFPRHLLRLLHGNVPIIRDGLRFLFSRHTHQN